MILDRIEEKLKQERNTLAFKYLMKKTEAKSAFAIGITDEGPYCLGKASNHKYYGVIPAMIALLIIKFSETTDKTPEEMIDLIKDAIPNIKRLDSLREQAFEDNDLQMAEMHDDILSTYFKVDE